MNPRLMVLCFFIAVQFPAKGQSTLPVVAVHDSELTRALANMNATAPTPSGAGTTGKEWWTTNWNYFVMPESLKETFRSDGTAFTTIGDSNITAGILLSNGQPRFPIVISLASEAIRDDQIAQFTNYVAAGGFLFVGSSSFTRNTNGTTRGDFAFASQMGVNMVMPGLTNWVNNTTLSREIGLDHRLVNHIPSRSVANWVNWNMPSSSEEVSWGKYPRPLGDGGRPDLPHFIWRVSAASATVLAYGNVDPYLTIKPYGKGYFIYYAPQQALVAHGGWGVGMYTYVIFRRAIEWAFESVQMPIPKVSPWPYQHNAAFMVRHDIEDYADLISGIEASALSEWTNGAKGDYYFCSGTLREDMANSNAVIASLRSAITNYGATLGPHNGGFPNPNTNGPPPIDHGAYNFWHWGPDEALDNSFPGFANGKAYALHSLSNSFINFETWFAGLMTNGMRAWVSPFFNATREDSYDMQAQLNVKINGDQKLSPFPHWTLSTKTSGKRYAHLSQPVSDWFVEITPSYQEIAQRMEDVPSTTNVHALVDFYYDLGALVNFYSHMLSSTNNNVHGGGTSPLPLDYITYGLNTNLHPRIWSANAIMVYDWWLQRSNVQINATYTTNNGLTNIILAVSGAQSQDTAVEILLPGTNGVPCLSVYTNGVLAGADVYRTVGQTVRVKVGTSVTSVQFTYGCSFGFAENFDSVTAPGLPPGWTTSASGGQSAWFTTNNTVDSSPNTAFSAGAASAGISELVSPTITMPSGQAKFRFRNRYQTQTNRDGGVLEIKIGGGAFTDIITAGGSWVTGGYNSTLLGGSGNSLAGRAAWSGNSSGFITSEVNLPAGASGQLVQFKWRFATDNSTSSAGWRVDTITFPNNAPSLPAQTNRTISELTTLLVTNVATDLETPPQSLSYELVSPPAGAVITNGVIAWYATEAQGPGSYDITTIVTDGGVPPLSATNTFTVTVNEANIAPVLPLQTNRMAAKLVLMTVNNGGTDADLPANTLNYTLAVTNSVTGVQVANASIDSATGVISWTPTALQDPSTNEFTTRVSDNGSPILRATNKFTVIVSSQPTLGLNSAMLTGETCFPTNNAIDAGESVTVSFSLLNTGFGDTTNLVVTLLDTNGVINASAAQNYGVVTAGGAAVARSFAFTANAACGSNITATLQMQDGAANLGTIGVTFPLGALGTVLTQNFDAVTIPALPTGAGWSTVFGGTGMTGWYTTNTTVHTAPNAAFSHTVPNVATNLLISPAISLSYGTNQLTFRNNYNLEATAGIGYDGGVLEIKIGAGNWQDILAAGGSFVSGGYNRTIDTGYQSPIAGRQAWSSTSGGYVTTLVNLPASAGGQSIQLRWLCATDNGTAVGGWRVDSIGVIGRVCCVNSAPTLPGQTNRSIPEQSSMTVTNTASDPGVPANSLTYTLGATNLATGLQLAGASIDGNGVITWLPTEAQGPSTNIFVTRAVNSGVPTLATTNSFTVTVTEVNEAPVLPARTNLTVAELTTLTVTNTAGDSDLPANPLNYSLAVTNLGTDQPVTNASIDSNGVITWTPTEAQGPGTNRFVTIVNDGNASATNSFDVVVTEVNEAPVLGALNPVSLSEGTSLEVTNSATDGDLPVNALSYQLLGAPGYASINGVGIISLNPTEADGPVTNTFATVVSDGLASATNFLTVTVTEVNETPVLPAQTNVTVAELTTLTVTNTASDADVPANLLNYSLAVTNLGTDQPVTNASIDSNGVITWTPTEAQGPGTNRFVTIVNDGNASATNSFDVVVTEVNEAPVLGALNPVSLSEGTSLEVTNSATDGDLPVNALSYQLLGAPGYASINGVGIISLNPTEADGPVTNTFATVVSDGLASATNFLTVTVTEANEAPVLPAQTNLTVAELTTLTVTNTASDADVPANLLNYSLAVTNLGTDQPVTNASIDSNGVITWTPTEAQGPGTNRFVTIVNDGNASATNSFDVVVTEVNEAPVLPAQTNVTVAELTTLTVTNTAGDSDLPANLLNYSLAVTNLGTDQPVTNASIDSNGVITWTPTEAQGPGTNRFVTIVNDGNASATNSFDVVVTEVNEAPVLPEQTDLKMAVSSALTVTNTATDVDLPVNPLNYSLLTAPTNAGIDILGIITWTPTQAQSPSTNTFTTMVSDGIASATNTFTVIVTNLPVVPPPVIESISFANDVATVTWSTVEGRNYRLQFRDTPWSTNWTDSPPDIPGTGGSVNGTNVLNGAIQRFYRVLLVPLP